VLGVARRLPSLELPKVEWAAADIARDELAPLFHGSDCVVQLAWLIQPSHDLLAVRRTNVDGSARVFDAVATAGVPSLVYASSVGAYAPGPKDRAVGESWPVDGIRTSYYSRQKAEVERLLDRFELEHPAVRVVRLRPGLIFKLGSATGQRRLFAGPLLPTRLLKGGRIPFVPSTPRLRFQAVHSHDVAEAYRLAIVGSARGAFNVAADPVVGPDELASLLRARKLPVPEWLLRGAAQLTWKLHLQPSDVGWVDMGLNVPIMDTARARDELGWSPRHSSLEALGEVIDGVRRGVGAPTPPLEPRSRVEEVATGVGETEAKRGSSGKEPG